MLKKYLKVSVSLLLVISLFALNYSFAANGDSNTNLSSLYLSVQGLNPDFSKDKTNYSLFVPSSVSDISVNATPESSNSRVEVSGNNNLKSGDNLITINVIAQSGDSKKYSIIVTKTDNQQQADSYLQNLILQNVNLSPAFGPQVLNYDGGQIANDVNNILIFVSPEQDGATYEIVGNDNLKTGDNVITIKVTSADKTTTKEYTVKVNKVSNKTTEDIVKENAQNDTSNQNTDSIVTSNNNSTNSNDNGIINNIANNKKLIIVLSSCILILIILIIIIAAKKHKKNNK